MNPRLDLLHPYPFERLRRLFEGVLAQGREINLGIGEPQHPTPAVITEALIEAVPLLGKYPPTAGTLALRETIAGWIGRRYGVAISEREVLPVAGSREALFAFAQAVLDPSDPGVVLLPNPFYQIYEGAALMAGAEPFYVPTPSHTGGMPEWSAVPAEVWPRVRLAYVCSPGNPTGAVMDEEGWKTIFDLADRYGFIVAADECYSEIYTDSPPTGALQARGAPFERVVSFNSLSKRSSAPGLRSGFVAGDADIVRRFLHYRTYHGSAPSLVVQAASIAAWNDEGHVIESRNQYRAKFEALDCIRNRALRESGPSGGFFLWVPVPGSDERFARELYASRAITVLPGSYLAREAQGVNPGKGFVRIAMVPELDVCAVALELIEDFMDDEFVGDA